MMGAQQKPIHDVLNSVPLNKPYMPALSHYQSYIERMYANVWLTNNGPLAQEFAKRLRDYLDVPYLVLTCNGTAALQLAFNLFNLKGNVVTSPFSFVATASSANWVGLATKFADIDSKTLNMSARHIEKAIDANTSAIVPVHVYGNPCDTKAISKIATNNGLKVVYDAAHAFGITQNKKSILSAGDASALSLHATKLFHCIEGGALILNNEEDYLRAQKIINFGINNNNGEIPERGFNGKMSEAHAAMGLAMLDDIDHVLEKRLGLYNLYKKLLSAYVDFPLWDEESSQNAAYMPIILKTKKQTERVMSALSSQGVQTRKYFYPSLNTLRQFTNNESVLCPNSERIAQKVLCLPLFYSLDRRSVRFISEIIIEAVKC